MGSVVQFLAIATEVPKGRTGHIKVVYQVASAKSNQAEKRKDGEAHIY